MIEQANTASGEMPAAKTPGAAGHSIQQWDLDPHQRSLFLNLDRPLALRRHEGQVSVCPPGDLKGAQEICGWLPALPLGSLGDPAFMRAHGCEQAYVVGAMANGITSVQMVQRAAKAGLLAIFGAAGLSVSAVEQALETLSALGPAPWGCNLIYTPHERGWESSVVDLCLRYQVPTVCASAYLDLSEQVLRLRAKGLKRSPDGQIVAARRLIVKLSRVELARKFMLPPPAQMLERLVQRGEISEREAELAAELPVATDITVEADSGGHTDNRPSLAQFPAVLALRQSLGRQFPQVQQVRLGAAGGLGTPAAVAAAFAMGAAYVVTGSVNQACVESGSSDLAREMLAGCGQADVAMAPAADMFEMGVKLQVLRRGTMFAMRAQKLYDLYRTYPGYDAIPAKDRGFIEDKLFRASVAEIWSQTQRYWSQRDPSQLAKAEDEPRHRMALLFRWYLGQASRWANQGQQDRQADYQIWCGPSMGAFNAWTLETPLATAGSRRVDAVARAMMQGAALRSRAYLAKLSGLALGEDQLAAMERTLLFSNI